MRIMYIYELAIANLQIPRIQPFVPRPSPLPTFPMTLTTFLPSQPKYKSQIRT